MDKQNYKNLRLRKQFSSQLGRYFLRTCPAILTTLGALDFCLRDIPRVTELGIIICFRLSAKLFLHKKYFFNSGNSQHRRSLLLLLMLLLFTSNGLYSALPIWHSHWPVFGIFFLPLPASDIRGPRDWPGESRENTVMFCLYTSFNFYQNCAREKYLVSPTQDHVLMGFYVRRS